MENVRVIQEPVNEDLFQYKAAHAAMMYYGKRINAVRGTPNNSPVPLKSPVYAKRQQVRPNFREKTYDPNIPHENSIRDRAPMSSWKNPDLGRCFSFPGAEAFSYPSEHYLENPEMYHSYYNPYLTKEQMDARIIQTRRLDVSPVRCFPSKVTKPTPTYHNYMLPPSVFAPPAVYGHNAMPSRQFVPEYPVQYQMEMPKRVIYQDLTDKKVQSAKDMRRFPDEEDYYSGSVYERSEYASSDPSSIISEDTMRDIISEDQIVEESQCDETDNMSIPEDSLEHSVEHFEQKLSHSIISGDVSPNIPFNILKQMRPKATSTISEQLSKKLEQLMEKHEYSQTDPISEVVLTHHPTIDKYISTEQLLGVDMEIQTVKEEQNVTGVDSVKVGVKSEGATFAVESDKWRGVDVLRRVSHSTKGRLGAVKGGVGSIKVEVGSGKSEVSNLKKKVGLTEWSIDGLKTEFTNVKNKVGFFEKGVGSVTGEAGSGKSEVSSLAGEGGSVVEGRSSLSCVTVTLSTSKFSNETVIVRKERDDKTVEDVNVNTDWTGMEGVDSNALVSDEIEICTLNMDGEYLKQCHSLTHLFQAAENDENETLAFRQYSDNFISYSRNENVMETVEVNSANVCDRFAETTKQNYQNLSVKLSEFAMKFCKHNDVQSNTLLQKDLDQYKRLSSNSRESQSVQRMKNRIVQCLEDRFIESNKNRFQTRFF